MGAVGGAIGAVEESHVDVPSRNVQESRCGGYGCAHARIDMLRDMLPGTPDPLGVRFSSAGIFGLVKQETLPCYCRLRRQPPRARIAPTLGIHIHRQQGAIRPDPRSAAAAM